MSSSAFYVFPRWSTKGVSTEENNNRKVALLSSGAPRARRRKTVYVERDKGYVRLVLPLTVISCFFPPSVGLTSGNKVKGVPHLSLLRQTATKNRKNEITSLFLFEEQRFAKSSTTKTNHLYCPFIPCNKSCVFLSKVVCGKTPRMRFSRLLSWNMANANGPVYQVYWHVNRPNNAKHVGTNG